MKFICVCTPTLGNVSIEWSAALRDLMWPMNHGYMNIFMKDDVGGEIAECRNKCVQIALGYESEEREITHLFWLDDDVISPRTALLALKNINTDIASGVYFTKGEPSEPLMFPGRGCGTSLFVPDQRQELWGHGMGLTLIKLDVYKHMMKHSGTDKYGNPQWYKTPTPEDATIENQTVFAGGTEDLYFLEAASKLGYKPVVDTSRHCFGWHYDGKRKCGYPEKQWKQYQSRQPVTWETSNGTVTWGG